MNDSLKFFIEFLASWCWFLFDQRDSENGPWCLSDKWSSWTWVRFCGRKSAMMLCQWHKTSRRMFLVHLVSLGEKFLKPQFEIVDIDWRSIENFLRFSCESWDFVSELLELFVAVADDFHAWLWNWDVSWPSIPERNYLSAFKRSDGPLKDLVEVVS